MRKIISNKRLLKIPRSILLSVNPYKEELITGGHLRHSPAGFASANELIFQRNISFPDLTTYNEELIGDRKKMNFLFLTRSKKKGKFSNYLLSKYFLKILTTEKIYLYIFRNNQMLRVIYGNMKYKPMMKLFKDKLKRRNKDRLGIYNLLFTLERKLTTILYLAFMIPKLKSFINFLHEGHVYVNKRIVRKYNCYIHPDDICGIKDTSPFHLIIPRALPSFDPTRVAGPLMVYWDINKNKYLNGNHNGYLRMIVGLDRLFYRFLRFKLKTRENITNFIFNKANLLHFVNRDELKRRNVGFILNSSRVGVMREAPRARSPMIYQKERSSASRTRINMMGKRSIHSLNRSPKKLPMARKRIVTPALARVTKYKEKNSLNYRNYTKLHSIKLIHETLGQHGVINLTERVRKTEGTEGGRPERPGTLHNIYNFIRYRLRVSFNQTKQIDKKKLAIIIKKYLFKKNISNNPRSANRKKIYQQTQNYDKNWFYKNIGSLAKSYRYLLKNKTNFKKLKINFKKKITFYLKKFKKRSKIYSRKTRRGKIFSGRATKSSTGPTRRLPKVNGTRKWFLRFAKVGRFCATFGSKVIAPNKPALVLRKKRENIKNSNIITKKRGATLATIPPSPKVVYGHASLAQANGRMVTKGERITYSHVKSQINQIKGNIRFTKTTSNLKWAQEKESFIGARAGTFAKERKRPSQLDQFKVFKIYNEGGTNELITPLAQIGANDYPHNSAKLREIRSPSPSPRTRFLANQGVASGSSLPPYLNKKKNNEKNNKNQILSFFKFNMGSFGRMIPYGHRRSAAHSKFSKRYPHFKSCFGNFYMKKKLEQFIRDLKKLNKRGEMRSERKGAQISPYKLLHLLPYKVKKKSYKVKKKSYKVKKKSYKVKKKSSSLATGMRKKKIPKVGRHWGVNLFKNKGRRRNLSQPAINGILIGNSKNYRRALGGGASEERKNKKKSQIKKRPKARKNNSVTVKKKFFFFKRTLLPFTPWERPEHFFYNDSRRFLNVPQKPLFKLSKFTDLFKNKSFFFTYGKNWLKFWKKKRRFIKDTSVPQPASGLGNLLFIYQNKNYYLNIGGSGKKVTGSFSHLKAHLSMVIGESPWYGEGDLANLSPSELSENDQSPTNNLIEKYNYHPASKLADWQVTSFENFNIKLGKYFNEISFNHLFQLPPTIKKNNDLNNLFASLNLLVINKNIKEGDANFTDDAILNKIFNLIVTSNNLRNNRGRNLNKPENVISARLPIALVSKTQIKETDDKKKGRSLLKVDLEKEFGGNVIRTLLLSSISDGSFIAKRQYSAHRGFANPIRNSPIYKSGTRFNRPLKGGSKESQTYESILRQINYKHRYKMKHKYLSIYKYYNIYNRKIKLKNVKRLKKSKSIIVNGKLKYQTKELFREYIYRFVQKQKRSTYLKKHLFFWLVGGGNW